MTPAERLERWTALVDEAVSLARDFSASLIIDADHADPRLDMRMSALRGQVRGLDYAKLPFPAWEAGREFLWLAGEMASDEAITAQRASRARDLMVQAQRLLAALETTHAARRRADLDD